MYFLLEMGIFHCYVSLPEGIKELIMDFVQRVHKYPILKHEGFIMPSHSESGPLR